MDSSFWPWKKRLSMQYRHTSSPRPKKIQNNAVCRQDSFDCFLGLSKSLHDRIFGSWEYCQFSSVHWNNKKNLRRRVCRVRGGQHRGFCWCVTMQDSSRNDWSSGEAEVWGSVPSALQPWLGANRFPFLSSPQEGSQGGLISPHMMKWSKLWRHGSNKELLNSSLTACVNLFYVGEKCIERQGDYVEK